MFSFMEHEQLQFSSSFWVISLLLKLITGKESKQYFKILFLPSANTPACASRYLSRRGCFDSRIPVGTPWAPRNSLLSRVHTLMAKSCSFGSGQRSERASLSYSVGVYKSLERPEVARTVSVRGEQSGHGSLREARPGIERAANRGAKG